MGVVTAEEAARFAQAAETGQVPGQTTVDDHLEPDQPHDDPDHPGWSGRDEFVAEAGQATGDLSAQQPRPRDETVYVEEIRIDGTTQTALDVGGKRALSATLTVSGKATVDGSLRKGDVLTGTFTAVVRGVASKDKVDKASGVVVEAEEKFTAQLVDLELD